jgi:hypothetical protein
MSMPSGSDANQEDLKGDAPSTDEATKAQAKEKAKLLLEEQKDVGAGRLDDFAQAIRGAGDQLAPEMPQTARYIKGAASSLREASASLRERKVEDLLGAIGDFACRQPAVFFGGAVIAGLALSHLLGHASERAGNGKDRR